ncbi:MFS transporter [Skermanella mucosa]|uniref:MFS transporter n=1 Tax=Skermanella mucosa TaxID=1789672 RepID=UPI00192BC67B|nr:MFS transporter [Skermanella mucosa]UEM23275.1 MFS transporter [Skermanella mucosa]
MTQELAVAEHSRPAQARIAVAVIFFVNGTALSSWVPHIPTVQQKLGLSTGTLGLALLGIAGGSLVSMPIAGWLIARHGSRVVTLTAAILYCLATPPLLLASSLPALIMALILFGAFNGAMDVAMNAHGVAVERAIGRPVMSSLHALFSIGGLVGAGSAVVLLPIGMTPAAHVTAAATGGLLLVLASARFLLPRGVDISTGGGPRFVLPRGRLLVLGAMGFFILMMEGAMSDWTAVYLKIDLGTGAAFAGLGYAVFSAAMAVGRLTGDRMVASFGPVAMVRWGSLLAAAGLGGALLLHDPVAAVVGFGLVGLGLANIVPILFSAAGRTPGMAPGLAIAAVTTAGYFGFLAGPPLVGLVAEVLGLPGSLGILAAAVGLMAFRSGVLEPREGRVQS